MWSQALRPQSPSDQNMWRAATRKVISMSAVAVGLGLAGCSGAVEPTPASTSTPAVQPAPTTRSEGPQASSDILDKGAELYAANCQTCHGDREGRGLSQGAPPHSETGHTWHHPDAHLKDWVMNGKLGFGQMPPFREKLTEAETEAILAFIKTWWTPDQRESQANVSRRYQEALEKYEKGQ
jgi:mono/diheme cytochrome c family protein